MMFVRLLAAALFGLVVASPVRAATVFGAAADPAGAPVAAAQVTLLNLATGAQQTLTSGDDGRFRFENLPVGIYRVTIERDGFSEDARTLSIAGPDEALELSFVLRPGGLTAGVTVTALRSERDPLQIPLRTDRITDEQLELQQPLTTGDALLAVPSVTPVGSGPFGVRPRLRGLDSTRLLVLVDGERLNNARTATDRAGIEVGLVDVNSVRSVDVVGGAGSVLYGTDALAGTINIITTQPSFSDDLRVDYGFDGLISSNETGRRGTALFGVSGRRFAVQFQGTLEEFDNYTAGGDGREDTRPFFDSGQLRNADTVDDAFGFRLGAFPDPFNAPYVRETGEVPRSSAQGRNINLTGLFALPANQTLRVKYITRRVEDIGFPDFEAPVFFQAVTLPYSSFDRLTVRYEAQGIRPWFTNLRVSAYYQDQDRLLRNEFPVQFPVPSARFFPISVFRLQIRSDTRQHVRTPGVDIQATFVPRRNHVVTAGLTAYQDGSRDSRRSETQTTMIGRVDIGSRGPFADVFPSPIILGPPSVDRPVRVPDADFRDLGIFAQDEWDVSPVLRLIGGIRLDGYAVSTDPTTGYDVGSVVRGAEPPIPPSALPDPAGDRLTRAAFTGQLGAVLRLNDRWSVLAHYGRSYRHPNIEELLFAGPATVGAIAPNLEVEPEKGHNVDVGVRARSSRYAGSMAYFTNTFNGFISTEIVAVNDREPLSQAINFADVRIQGVEAEGETPLEIGPATITLFAATAWTRGTVLSGRNPLSGVALDGTPQDNITPFKGIFGARFADRRDRFWVEYGVRVQSEVKRVARTLLDSPFLIAQDLLSLDGFGVQRLAGGVELRRTRGRAAVTFAVENLADRFYREHFQFAPARGRSFTVGLHVRGW